LSLWFEVDFLSPKNPGCIHHGIVKQTKTNDVLNTSDLCFVNYGYMFKNSSLKSEKATVS